MKNQCIFETRKSSIWQLREYSYVLAIAYWSLLSFGHHVWADNPNVLRASSVTVTLRAKAECPSNVLLLSDMVELQGSDAIVHQIADLPLAPAPNMGNKQTWSRASIEKMLQLRGLASEAIRWRGSDECEVHRVEGVRPKKSDMDTANGANDGSVEPPMIHQAQYTQVGTNDSPVKAPAVDRSKFTAPFTTPVTLSVAERFASEAISNYLQTKTNSNGRWNIKVNVPSEYAGLLSQRAKILGVAGGQPPWEGEQEFQFLVKGPNGEQSISVRSMIQLPEMVVSANRPLAKGYVLKEEDLDWIPFPPGAKFGADDCFKNVEALVGQQLRRSMSTQQVIRMNEVGPPTLIQVGDVIQVEVVSGAVVVGTQGRAIESGGMDDLIQVEIEPNRNRVLARITNEKTVEVVASSGRTSSSKSKTSNASQNKTIR
jgi:flagella basal body P-ring formation protein FlgA